ncbi:LPXTG cell wall anchor domain-containing protein [Jatrophihabitans telluris]|uniref:LPXTG cell wall anchor domain-containing protein n=1 Tax=Jatrophihabitans telluris TaxID=2038343 RepID=A0ABY4QYV6_9ACTN|nr:LPXTG cell wall anchor domain-containing protein [Jatrophihabitans telluris]UQX88759.1 LPXTG cell wall anchor domain-containing protein [Jatrophihabitans telluris]
MPTAVATTGHSSPFLVGLVTVIIVAVGVGVWLRKRRR